MDFDAGDSINTSRGGWNFQDIDSKGFENHVSKSVPNYYEGHEYIRFLSDYFIHNDSVIYDIGCSTGSLISKLSKAISNRFNVIEYNTVNPWTAISAIATIQLVPIGMASKA